MFQHNKIMKASDELYKLVNAKTWSKDEKVDSVTHVVREFPSFMEPEGSSPY
jgi:hypothetical protein